MKSPDFFREMTLCLSSSLDLQVCMHRCLLKMQGFLPVRRMLLALYDPGQKAIQFLVDATREKVGSIDELLPLPGELNQFTEGILRSGVPRSPVVQEGRATPMGGLVEAFLGENASKVWTMLMEVEGKKLAMLGLCPWEKEALAPSHRALVASLQAPFSLAVANGLLHRENLALQKTLSDDNRFLREQLWQLQGMGSSGRRGWLERHPCASSGKSHRSRRRYCSWVRQGWAKMCWPMRSTSYHRGTKLLLSRSTVGPCQRP